MPEALGVGPVGTTKLRLIRRFFATPVGKPFNVIVALLALWTLWLFSPPAPSFLAILIVYPWGAAGLYWFLRTIILLLEDRRMLRRNSARVLVAPAVVCVLVALIYLDAPARARFELSENAMTGLATRVIREPAADHPKRVGLYQISDVEVIPEGMRFIIDGSGFLDRWGFAYSPGGPPSDRGLFHYSHWDGPWYLVREEF